MKRTLHDLVRPNVQALQPYSCARDEYSGKAARVFLDANESPYNAPLNRYPDPLQQEVKAELSRVKGIRPDCIFLGNGSDEAIDLVLRIFCVPGTDNVVAPDPTYGMYSVCAAVNDVEYRRVPLRMPDFALRAEDLLAVCNRRTKALFLCSPNNPTGNLLERDEMLRLVETFDGMVVVDEAYGDFSGAPSWLREIPTHPNLIVLQTFSKAWASAGARLGIAMAVPEVVDYFNKVKYPYNVNTLTQQHALEMLRRRFDVERWVRRTLDEREKVVRAVRQLPFYVCDYPTDANFFLVKMEGATRIYDYLVREGIIVRNRSTVRLCDDCLRITIGLPNENNELLAALRRYQ